MQNCMLKPKNKLFKEFKYDTLPYLSKFIFNIVNLKIFIEQKMAEFEFGVYFHQHSWLSNCFIKLLRCIKTKKSAFKEFSPRQPWRPSHILLPQQSHCLSQKWHRTSHVDKVAHNLLQNIPSSYLIDLTRIEVCFGKHKRFN